MKLPTNLLRQFVKATNDTLETKNETIAYGTVVNNGLSNFVRFDGSSVLTPVSMTMDAQDGDRVMVMIKNHIATIIGNVTSPASARTAMNYIHFDSVNGLIMALQAIANAEDVANLAGSNVRMTTDGLAIYIGNTKVADYGETVTVGNESETHLSVTPSGIVLYSGTENPIIQFDRNGIPSDKKILFGDPNKSHILLGGGNISVYNDNGEAIVHVGIRQDNTTAPSPIHYYTPFNTLGTRASKTSTSGAYSTAIGYENVANAIYSVAIGLGLIATEHSQIAVGRYNKSDKDAIFIVGNGSEENRSNAFTVDKNGGIHMGKPYITAKTISAEEGVDILPNKDDNDPMGTTEVDMTLSDYKLLGIVDVNTPHGSVLLLTEYYTSGETAYVKHFNRSTNNTYSTQGTKITGLYRYAGDSYSKSVK